jgi:hypothetical protein
LIHSFDVIYGKNEYESLYMLSGADSIYSIFALGYFAIQVKCDMILPESELPQARHFVLTDVSMMSSVAALGERSRRPFSKRKLSYPARKV